DKHRKTFYLSYFRIGYSHHNFQSGGRDYYPSAGQKEPVAIVDFSWFSASSSPAHLFLYRTSDCVCRNCLRVDYRNTHLPATTADGHFHGQSDTSFSCENRTD